MAPRPVFYLFIGSVQEISIYNYTLIYGVRLLEEGNPTARLLESDGGGRE